jgi:hypothetical protein
MAALWARQDFLPADLDLGASLGVYILLMTLCPIMQIISKSLDV